MSHVKNWKKGLITVLILSAAQVAFADDPVPAFMQYNKSASNQETTSAAPDKKPTQPAANITPTTSEVAPIKPAQPTPAAAETKLATPQDIKPKIAAGAASDAKLAPVAPVAPVASSKPVMPAPIGQMPLTANQNAPAPAVPATYPMDGRFHEQIHLSPDALSEQERINQLRKSAAESEASLWQAKAKQAQAQAAYEEAMKKITDVRMPPQPPVDPKAEAAIAQLNEMASKQGFHGIKIMSTYGETHGKMYADVMFNGTPMTVARGDKLGEWRVVKVSTTYIKVANKGEQKDLFIHTN